MVTSSFYGKQKAIYLTPLERKALKDSLPPPPSLHPPPSQARKPEENKKSVKGGNKMKRVSATSSKTGKMNNKSRATSAKTKPSKLSRFVHNRIIDVSFFPV